MLLDEAMHGDLPVVTLNGRIDSRTADVLADELLGRIVDGRRALVVDLAKVDYVGAAGLRVLLMIAARAASYGIGLRLCCVQPAVADVFAASGLAGRFRIHDDVGDTLET